MRGRKGEKLVDGIERQELQARDLVDPLARNLLERRLEHPVRAGIAIMDGIAQKGVAAAYEAEINAPCIDADSIERAVTGLRDAFLDGGFQFVKKPRQVPVEGVEYPDGAVGEAMNFLEVESRSVKPSEQPAAALGPRSSAR